MGAFFVCLEGSLNEGIFEDEFNTFLEGSGLECRGREISAENFLPKNLFHASHFYLSRLFHTDTSRLETPVSIFVGNIIYPIRS